ncbi:hypothetical protein BDQ17DRAFT_1437102 [Cyathus striatus]|nr:hypothetical protein BDQ17DRAFT_1437102 [Cyathus striatus]
MPSKLVLSAEQNLPPEPDASESSYRLRCLLKSTRLASPQPAGQYFQVPMIAHLRVQDVFFSAPLSRVILLTGGVVRTRTRRREDEVKNNRHKLIRSTPCLQELPSRTSTSGKLFREGPSEGIRSSVDKLATANPSPLQTSPIMHACCISSPLDYGPSSSFNRNAYGICWSVFKCSYPLPSPLLNQYPAQTATLSRQTLASPFPARSCYPGHLVEEAFGSTS